METYRAFFTIGVPKSSSVWANTPLAKCALYL